MIFIFISLLICFCGHLILLFFFLLKGTLQRLSATHHFLEPLLLLHYYYTITFNCSPTYHRFKHRKAVYLLLTEIYSTKCKNMSQRYTDRQPLVSKFLSSCIKFHSIKSSKISCLLIDFSWNLPVSTNRF